MVGDGDVGGIGELSLEGVFEDLGNAVVIEGQVASKPVWEGGVHVVDDSADGEIV